LGRGSAAPSALAEPAFGNYSHASAFGGCPSVSDAGVGDFGVSSCFPVVRMSGWSRTVRRTRRHWSTPNKLWAHWSRGENWCSTVDRGTTSGRSTSYVLPSWRDGGGPTREHVLEPNPRRARTGARWRNRQRSAPPPPASSMNGPMSVRRGGPPRRTPGEPADLIASGLIARPSLRTPFTTAGDFVRIPSRTRSRPRTRRERGCRRLSRWLCARPASFSTVWATTLVHATVVVQVPVAHRQEEHPVGQRDGEVADCSRPLCYRRPFNETAPNDAPEHRRGPRSWPHNQALACARAVMTCPSASRIRRVRPP
jgi:hypothetical protein